MKTDNPFLVIGVLLFLGLMLFGLLSFLSLPDQEAKFNSLANSFCKDRSYEVETWEEFPYKECYLYEVGGRKFMLAVDRDIATDGNCWKGKLDYMLKIEGVINDTLMISDDCYQVLSPQLKPTNCLTQFRTSVEQIPFKVGEWFGDRYRCYGGEEVCKFIVNPYPCEEWGWSLSKDFCWSSINKEWSEC